MGGAEAVELTTFSGDDFWESRTRLTSGKSARSESSKELMDSSLMALSTLPPCTTLVGEDNGVGGVGVVGASIEVGVVGADAKDGVGSTLLLCCGVAGAPL